MGLTKSAIKLGSVAPNPSIEFIIIACCITISRETISVQSCMEKEVINIQVVDTESGFEGHPFKGLCLYISISLNMVILAIRMVKVEEGSGVIKTYGCNLVVHYPNGV